MRFVVKEKLISISGKYYIKDENDKDVYVVKGSFSIPKKYRVFDMSGKEIIKVKKRLFRIFATVDFIQNDNIICTAKRKFSLRPKYEFTGKGDYSIDGTVFAYNYRIKKGNEIAATVFKEITFVRDAYIIDVAAEEDVPIVLGIAVMFDHIHHRGNDNMIG